MSLKPATQADVRKLDHKIDDSVARLDTPSNVDARATPAGLLELFDDLSPRANLWRPYKKIERAGKTQS